VCDPSGLASKAPRQLPLGFGQLDLDTIEFLRNRLPVFRVFLNRRISPRGVELPIPPLKSLPNANRTFRR
jgi:hypothetical protein